MSSLLIGRQDRKYWVNVNIAVVHIGTPKSATKTHYGSFWQKLGGGGGLAKIFRNGDWLRVSASEEKICSRAKTTFFCKQNNFTKLLTLLFFVNSVLLSYFNI